MKRFFTTTCLAAAFAVGLAAQSTGTSGTATAAGQDPQTQPGGPQRGGGPRTAVGCLRAGDTAGSYMLTDVVMQGGRAGAASTTGAAAGTSTGTTAGTGTAAAGAQGAAAPMSIMLSPAADVDLKPHIGHKIEVTGTVAGGRGRGQGGDATAGTATGTATGATAGGTTTGGGTTATGTTTGTGTGATARGGQGGGRGPRNMTVTSIRMISDSCS
jgi:hypothetical protein